METKLILRQVILEKISDEALMTDGMLTLKQDGKNETAIEELLGMELDFEKSDCNEFPCRIYKDNSGNIYKTLPDNLLMVAVLQFVFGVVLNNHCNGDCKSCVETCDIK